MNIQGASIECGCGECVGVEDAVSTVRCVCGVTYAVTVTKLVEPGER